MLLVKDGIKLELEREPHIAAFLSSGWTEAKIETAPAPEDKTEKKTANKK